jgi:aminopeptidase 2
LSLLRNDSDLWKGIAEASGVDVEKLMESWVLKVGFPLVTVQEANDGLIIRQSRYLGESHLNISQALKSNLAIDTADPSDEENQTLWKIPLLLLTRDGTDTQIMLTDREAFVPLRDARNVFYKLNGGTAGVCKRSICSSPAI